MEASNYYCVLRQVSRPTLALACTTNCFTHTHTCKPAGIKCPCYLPCNTDRTFLLLTTVVRLGDGRLQQNHSGSCSNCSTEIYLSPSSCTCYEETVCWADDAFTILSKMFELLPLSQLTARHTACHTGALHSCVRCE